MIYIYNMHLSLCHVYSTYVFYISYKRIAALWVVYGGVCVIYIMHRRYVCYICSVNMYTVTVYT